MSFLRRLWRRLTGQDAGTAVVSHVLSSGATVPRRPVATPPPVPKPIPRPTLRNLRKDRSRTTVIQNSRLDPAFTKPHGHA